MSIKKLLFWSIWVGILFFEACQPEKKTNTVEETPARIIPVPRFDRDSAFAYVARQVDFGPRVPNSDAHQACKEWLVAQFQSFGAEVIQQDFQAKAYTGAVLQATNIIAQFNPDSKKRILLAAHWDSRHIADSPLSAERKDEPILGADDGASGVGVLLEVARQLQANPIEMGVDIILFDAEDYGESNGADETWALGSQHWSGNPHVPGYRARFGILLDMVGAREARFPKEQVSMSYAPELVNKVWKLAGDMGYSNYFVPVAGGSVMDDHYYVNSVAGIPMIDIINLPANSANRSFGDHWHTHNDNMDIIDNRTLRAVGQVLLAVVYREASGTF